MTGFNVKFNDGVAAKVTGIAISETYSGVLAGTLTVATHHILPRYLAKMMDVAIFWDISAFRRSLWMRLC